MVGNSVCRDAAAGCGWVLIDFLAVAFNGFGVA